MHGSLLVGFLGGDLVYRLDCDCGVGVMLVAEEVPSEDLLDASVGAKLGLISVSRMLIICVIVSG
jgi:hypothetical protein